MNKISLKAFLEFRKSDKRKLIAYHFSKKAVTETELDKFTLQTEKWCKKTISVYYGIFSSEELVGVISLSKQNMELKRASIGYEIFPLCRNKGYASQAFLLVLKIAQEKGFKVISAKILKENEFSLKVWNKYKAAIVSKSENKYHLSISLD